MALTYGSPASLTIALASLANGSYAQSNLVDNSSAGAHDYHVLIKIKSNPSGVSSTGYVLVYASASVDGGTDFSGGATGSSGSYTAVTPPNLVLLGRISVVANDTTYHSVVFSIAQAFGGFCPQDWVLVVVNNSGAALDSSGSSVEYCSVTA